MSLATKKLSRLLRTREQNLLDLEAALRELTGKEESLAALAEIHDARLNQALDALGLPLEATAEEVYAALMNKVNENDKALCAHLGNPNCLTAEGCVGVVASAIEIAGQPKGFFLKKNVAERLFRQNPPKNLMRELGVDSVDKLLTQYPLEELFPGIRFAEDKTWLNDYFFRPFAALTPDDFEERPVEMVVLPERFRTIGSHYAGKKLHHISHLKELGIIFVMPIASDEKEAPAGSTLEILTLVLHYLHEVPFYSRIFQRYAKDPQHFASNLISALRGDVLPQAPKSDKNAQRILIVQRYLSKDDPDDPRLFLPHVNPEAVHWRLVEEKLDEYAKEHPELKLDFWRGLGSVGEYFPMGTGRDLYLARGVSEAVEISFDFIDNLISHNRQSPILAKYLYHQQEALWNHIFYSFYGRERIDAMMEENLEKGYIELQ